MRKSIVILAIGLVLSLGVMFARSTGQQESKPAQQHRPKIDKKEQSREVYRGLHNPYSEKIPVVAAKSKGDLKTEIEVGLPMLNPFAPSFNLYELLKSRGCDADAVIIATVKSEVSFLTEDETFLYTNHRVRIEDVLKDNSASPIYADNTITVIRSGGTMTLNGKRVIAVNKTALPIRLNKRYLLFLSYLPEKNAYVADNISVLLENNKIVKTTMEQLAKEMESGNDADDFIQSVRSALASQCPDTQGGTQ